MKANDYKIELLENGNGKLYVFQGVDKVYICELENLHGLTAKELKERVLLELKSRDIEIKDMDITDFMEEQKIDLSLVRTKMREIMKQLSNNNIPIKDRKELLDLYQQINSSAQIICNVCKIELQIDQLNNRRK